MERVREGADSRSIEAALQQWRSIARRIGEALSDVDAEDLDVAEWLDLQAELGAVVQSLNEPSRAVSAALGLPSAKARLRQYFLGHLGEVVTNAQLSGVAGTLEWARRVRELALEEGWDITRGPSDGLKPGEYRLDADEVDADRAKRWQLMNGIRRLPGSAASRCLRLLQDLYPDSASKEDLAYVAGIQEWPRRMRELEEAGWPIVSSSDDPTLRPGTYRLDSTDQGPKRQRKAIAQRHSILQRDGWTCQMCGATRASDPAVRLQIHHVRHVAKGGQNDDSNLITLCVPCHAGAHALDQSAVVDELLNPAGDPDAP